ncbi:MAG: HD domain-containing protein [Clostridium sp.]|nr:HD domain-containing protein [Clostridium sp.]
MKKAKLKNSLSFRYIIVSFLMCVTIYIITMAGSAFLYSNAIETRYANLCKTVSYVVAGSFDADSVDSWLKGEHTHSYIQATNKLEELNGNIPYLDSIAIYQMREDGMYTIYNTKSTSLRRDLGNVVSYDNKWETYKDAFLTGEKVENIFVNGYDGKVLTYCMPIFDSNGRCAAYVCSGISVNTIAAERSGFVKSFGMVLFVIIAALYLVIFGYFKSKIIHPVNKLSRNMGDPNRRDCIKHMRKLVSNDSYSVSDLQKIFRSAAKVFEEKIGVDTQNHKYQRDVICTFASVMSRSDVVSEKYTDHVGAYTRILCEELSKDEKFAQELDADMLNMLELAAPLHDIGKLSVPDEIIYKPSRLSDEEFDIIKNHVQYGADIIANVKKSMPKAKYLDVAYDIALYHHERYDGNGYIAQRSGEDIPLAARIVAIVDAFDAIVQKKCYHSAMEPEKAFDVISQDEGHFDPDILKCFMNVKDQIINEYNS